MKATTEKEIDATEFTAEKDYIGKTEDGREYLILAKGRTVPRAEAEALCVIKGAKTESKAAEPQANKSEAPAENKGGKAK